MANEDSRLVYLSETGRICLVCGRPLKKCSCKNKQTSKGSDLKSDGIIRIKKETKGRGGKIVTSISGFGERNDEVKQLASQLKNLCGTGGSVKDSVILIQGDYREAVREELENRGFTVKLAGG
jgi:translation initiation factor 1